MKTVALTHVYDIIVDIGNCNNISLLPEVKTEGDETFCYIEIFLIIINLYSHKVKFALFAAKYLQISRFPRGSKKSGTSNTSEEFIIPRKNYHTIYKYIYHL